jgi:hypothetical protein
MSGMGVMDHHSSKKAYPATTCVIIDVTIVIHDYVQFRSALH